MRILGPMLWLEAIVLGYVLIINFSFCCGNLLPSPKLSRLLESAPERPGRLYRYYSRINIPSPNSYDAMGTDVDVPTYVLVPDDDRRKEHVITRADRRLVDTKKITWSFVVHGKGTCEDCPPAAGGIDYMNVRFRMSQNISREIVSLVGFERGAAQWVEWTICLGVFACGCLIGYPVLSWVWRLHLRDLALAYSGFSEGTATLFPVTDHSPWNTDNPKFLQFYLLFPIWMMGLVVVKLVF